MDVEFKLFGNLTIRQFMSLVGAVVIAGLIYIIASPIGFPGIIFWPVIIGILFIGFAMAFMTINGQPFAKWFRNYVYAIFSSQRYVWQKTPVPPKSLTQNVPKVTQKSDKQIKKELGIMPLIEVMQEKNIELDEDEKKGLARIDQYFEAEFDKYTPQTSKNNFIRKEGIRVDPESANIAGTQNRVYDGDRIINVGAGKKVVFSSMNNQQSRALKNDNSDDKIEKKVKEILERQKELDPYIKTTELEQREQDLRTEMKKIYQEIQELKAKSNG